jgi:hypothetical protein
MSKRVVVGSALLAATLAACSGGHSSTSMPVASPAAVNGGGGTSTTTAASNSSATTATGNTASGTTTGADPAGVKNVILPTAGGTSQSGGPIQGTTMASGHTGGHSYADYGEWNQIGGRWSDAERHNHHPVGHARSGDGRHTHDHHAQSAGAPGSQPGGGFSGTFTGTVDFRDSHNPLPSGTTITATGSRISGGGLFGGNAGSTGGTAIAGGANGSLFGPGASEVGGVFTAGGGGTTTAGAFGAAKH